MTRRPAGSPAPPDARRGQWRGLDPTPADPAEFARPAQDGLGRRDALRLMAASTALAGLAACDAQPDDVILPHARDAANMTPGEARFYASQHVQDGVADGILVKTVDGRPVKIEGNPGHPLSRGGTDVFAQASILDLYDPNRSQAVLNRGRISSWDAFDNDVTRRFAALGASGGRGLRLLTGPLTSPSLIARIERLLASLPEARWHVHAAVDRANVYEGARLAFGAPFETRYAPGFAEAIVALDGDLLDPGPHQVAYARGWRDARDRAVEAGRTTVLHAAAVTPNLTSARADHVLPLANRRVPAVARALLARLDGGSAGGLAPREEAFVARAADDLIARSGRSLVAVGPGQPPEVHALAHRLNRRLGNVGVTVVHADPLIARAADPDATLARLAADMAAGAVTDLVMLDVNPVYTAPADLDFARLLAGVAWRLHAGLYADETSAHAQWHAPLAHPLESWGDARALDGTAGIVQPTVLPLYGGRSAHQLLSLLIDGRAGDGLAPVRAFWAGQPGGDERGWRRALLSGFVDGSAPTPRTPPLTPADPAPMPAEEPPGSGIEVLFRPDPTLWDGARASNTWLQELPKPLTKLVWGNAVMIAPAHAGREGLVNGDVVEVEAGGRRVRGPARLLPGQPDGTLTLHLGHGRTRALPPDAAGFDAYPLRAGTDLWSLSGAVLRATGERADLVSTEQLHDLPGHAFVRVMTPPAPGAVAAAHEAPSLLPPNTAPGARAWAMVIDLDACIGCNACAVACQAENNIPVVGPEQVAMGRDMHWLRIDRYYEGPPDNPETHFQPVPCMHCELAPCEVACPVEATLHDGEGLNLQVYNRCIGTRTCASYCPYKVRRFNWLNYAGGVEPGPRAQRNPDVTVRARGVMEKCTFCVQRIVGARANASRDDRPIGDGEVVTACQGACPTRAITFGDLADRTSAVAAARSSPRNYALLEELNLRPRTTYLAKLRPEDGTS